MKKTKKKSAAWTMPVLAVGAFLLASSAFAFSPPAGAKEFKAPPPGQGMPGMAPGGGPVHPGIGIKPGGTSK